MSVQPSKRRVMRSYTPPSTRMTSHNLRDELAHALRERARRLDIDGHHPAVRGGRDLLIGVGDDACHGEPQGTAELLLARAIAGRHAREHRLDAILVVRPVLEDLERLAHVLDLVAA